MESGYDCYYNSKTTEIVAIPNDSMVLDEALFEEAFGEDLKKVNKKTLGLLKLKVLNLLKSWKILQVN